MKTTWRELKCILLHERSRYVEAMHCVIPITRHFGEGKTGDSKHISGCQGLGERGVDRQITDFQGSDVIL